MKPLYRFVISHKSFEDERFNGRQILFVNNNIKKDNSHNEIESWTGDNIDGFNEYYCELTALYWIWKNIKEDCIVSFEHYRRVFITSKSNWFSYSFLEPKETERILNQAKLILPLRHHFKDTLIDQYKKNHVIDDLLTMKDVLLSSHPEYKESFDHVMNGHDAVLFNMFVMDKEILDSYCTFAFPILDEVFKRREEDIKGRDNYQKRAIGFLSERLFNIWLTHNFQEKDIFHCPVAHLDQKPFVHYLKDFYFKMRRKDYDVRKSKLRSGNK